MTLKSLKENLEIPNLWKTFHRRNQKRQFVWIIIFTTSTLICLYEAVDRIQILMDPPKSTSVKLLVHPHLNFSFLITRLKFCAFNKTEIKLDTVLCVCTLTYNLYFILGISLTNFCKFLILQVSRKISTSFHHDLSWLSISSNCS